MLASLMAAGLGLEWATVLGARVNLLVAHAGVLSGSRWEEFPEKEMVSHEGVELGPALAVELVERANLLVFRVDVWLVNWWGASLEKGLVARGASCLVCSLAPQLPRLVDVSVVLPE
jgi:hypothetical protein